VAMIGLEDVQRARLALRGVVHNTPLQQSATFSELSGADVYLKLENLQRTGSFKIRGAYNKISLLTPEERAAGVVAASAGNHAQGVALAARLAGIQATIVMPRFASLQKVMAVKGYGANLILHGKDYGEAEEKAFEVQKQTGATFVHAFNDPAIMAGQGTLGLEIIEAIPDVEVIVCPVGGGGLISGVATAVKAVKPDVRIVGVEPTGASKLPESLRKGTVVPLTSVNTIADGLATRRVGTYNLEVIQKRVDDVVQVGDDEIASAILLLLERAKTVVEGGGAASLAAVISGKVKGIEGKKVCTVLSGGNIDVRLVDHIIQRGLVQTGRSLMLHTILEDKPGSLRDLLALLAELQANVEAIEHDRTGLDIGVGQAEVRLKLDTRGHDHVAQILATLAERGYKARTLTPQMPGDKARAK